MCQYRFHAVLWSHILVHLLAVVQQDLYSPPSFPVEQPCWPCIWWCGTSWFQELGHCFLLALAARSLFIFYCFLFLFILSIGWYCGAGVFTLIGCKSCSPSLALPTSFNNNYTRSQTTFTAEVSKVQFLPLHTLYMQGTQPMLIHIMLNLNSFTTPWYIIPPGE